MELELGTGGQEMMEMQQGEAAGQDQRQETSQTSVHARKAEGESQARTRRAKLGAMGAPGESRARAVQSCSGGEETRGCSGKLCWTARWKRDLCCV